MKQVITTEYFVGQFVADGSISIGYNKSKKALDATFRISSKTNKNSLALSDQYLYEKLKIVSNVDTYSKNPTDRAPALRVQGVDKVLKVVSHILKNSEVLILGQTKEPIFGRKYRTLKVAKYLLENRSELIKLKKAELVDYLKTMHKDQYSDPDIQLGGSHTILRSELEERLGLDPGSSKGAAKEEIEKFDKQLVDQTNKILSAIANNSLIVNPWFTVGLTDGDGCFSASILHANDPSQDSDIDLILSLCSDGNAVVVNKVWLYALGEDTTNILSENSTLIYPAPIKDAITARINRDAYVWKALNFFKQNPPIGDLKKLGFELVYEIAAQKQNNSLKINVQKYIELILEYREKRALGEY